MQNRSQITLDDLLTEKFPTKYKNVVPNEEFGFSDVKRRSDKVIKLLTCSLEINFKAL